MLDFISRLLGRESTPSKTVAKERLRLVLVHDRASISPGMFDKIKEDIIQVLSRYVEIDKDALEVNLCQEEDEVALVANIPVVRMKRNYSVR